MRVSRVESADQQVGQRFWDVVSCDEMKKARKVFELSADSRRADNRVVELVAAQKDVAV